MLIWRVKCKGRGARGGCHRLGVKAELSQGVEECPSCRGRRKKGREQLGFGEMLPGPMDGSLL